MLYNDNVWKFFTTKKRGVSPERMEMELVRKLVKEFDFKTVADTQNLIKEIFGPMLLTMLEGELDGHFGCDKHKRIEDIKTNNHNGNSQKTATTSYGDFEPWSVGK